MQDEGFELYAWIGEDEFGSGEVGLKQGWTPNGLIALVSVDREKIQRDKFVDQMQGIANSSGKSRRLVRLVAVEELREVVPDDSDKFQNAVQNYSRECANGRHGDCTGSDQFMNPCNCECRHPHLKRKRGDSNAER